MSRRISIVIPAYRDADRALALLAAWRDQSPVPGWDTELIVVDDGSGDGSADRIATALPANARLHALPRNQGRAAARNAGAALATGDWLYFMDCDCRPAQASVLAAHLSVVAPGVVATTGPVVGAGHGFWDRYQADASARRARQHASGTWYSGSSQNLMVLRTAFTACGGFDARYRTYGFEDRDLLLRLGREGRVAWAPAAIVRHLDALSVPQVCDKMREAGDGAASLFSASHPEAYRALGYAKLDARVHAWLGPVAMLIEPFLGPLARAADRVVAARHVPFAPRSALVKALTAASYLVGTARGRASRVACPKV